MTYIVRMSILLYFNVDIIYMERRFFLHIPQVRNIILVMLFKLMLLLLSYAHYRA